MRGKERPSMDKVTTALERALAQLMGSPCNDQPILPTEVVLGSSRMHKKTSQRSSNRSAISETDAVEGDSRTEFPCTFMDNFSECYFLPRGENHQPRMQMSMVNPRQEIQAMLQQMQQGMG
ncbi:hypothetical protein OIU76_025280 [Salix suchowensis]|nr:hypothetical protein OIU76_025280 [Salix suchowensis]